MQIVKIRADVILKVAADAADALTVQFGQCLDLSYYPFHICVRIPPQKHIVIVPIVVVGIIEICMQSEPFYSVAVERPQSVVFCP